MKLFKSLIVVVTLVLSAVLPAMIVQAGPAFPPPVPDPHGVCTHDGVQCTWVCVVPEHNGRHWLQVQNDHLADVMAHHPTWFILGQDIWSFICTDNQLYIVVHP
jgi:hypothetical protein